MITNGDSPAAPIVSGGTICDVNSTMLAGAVGLTKREAFAMAAMQGLMSDCENWNAGNQMAQEAVLAADELLAALEESK